MTNINTAINIKALSKYYKKEQVLNDLDWQINQGDIVGLLGKNGAGKSTLIKSLLNINDIDNGFITIFEEDHKKLSAETKGRIGYVPQENDEISWLSVNDLIKFRKQFYNQWSDEKVVVFKNLCHFSKLVKTGMTHDNSIRFSRSSKSTSSR